MRVVRGKMRLVWQKLHWSWLVASCWLGASVHAAEVRMGIHNFPPDFTASADGSQCGGEGFDKLSEILAKADLHVVPTCVTPARMYLLLEQGQIDFSINIKSTHALQSVTPPLFAEPAYLELQLVLYSQTTQPLEPHTVAAIRGFDYQGERQRLRHMGFQFIDMPDAISAIEMFTKQRTNYLLTYEGPFKNYLQQHSSLAVTWQRKAMQAIPAYVVISAKSAYQQQIADALAQYARENGCRLLKSCPPSP